MTSLAVSAPQRARSVDRRSARRLLRTAGLLDAGLDEHFDGFWSVRTADGRPVGLAGTERYGATWLLRSLVVDPEYRGQRIGDALVSAVLDEARHGGARQVFLLTTDAQAFFAAHGFTTVPRASAPSALRASEQLRGACPDTATLMRWEATP
jgi:N-acetylglutamate synthase-like GNAT family acetyltransferase